MGGRRWAKFARELQKAGHRVSIVCADNGADNSWYEKEFPDMAVHILPRKYPVWLEGNAKNFTEKLLYHFSVRILSPLVSLNWFDKGSFWGKAMHSKLEALHAETPVDHLVVTGAPFSCLYYGSEFRKKHPEIHYTADFRDPWTWGHGYGMPSLSHRQKAEQERQEKAVMETADLITYPAESMGRHLAMQYPQQAGKCYTLSHAYDPADFPAAETKKERNGLIYGGTVYDGLEAWFNELENLLKKHPSLPFRWDIYTGSTRWKSDIGRRGIAEQVHIHGQIPAPELFRRMQEAKFYLVFFPPRYRDFISTKFFEVFYSGTPVIYVGAAGEVSAFIEQHGLGIHIEPGYMEERLVPLLEGREQVPQSRDFDIGAYSFEAVTRRWLQELGRSRKTSTQ